MRTEVRRKPFDAVVLAGGGGVRLGGADKAGIVIAGRTILDRVVDALAEAGTIVVVGPRRRTARPVTWTRERPPGEGPVHALRAGLALVRRETVAVAAADMPFVSGPVFDRLLGELHAGDGVCVQDEAGRRQPLLAVYRASALRAALEALPSTRGASMAALTSHLTMTAVPEGRAAFDVDTLGDLRQARKVR